VIALWQRFQSLIGAAEWVYSPEPAYAKVAGANTE
jgi:hypothetical protein